MTVMLYFLAVVLISENGNGVTGVVSATGADQGVGRVTDPSRYGGVSPVREVLESSIYAASLRGKMYWNYTTVLELTDHMPVPDTEQDCVPRNLKLYADGPPLYVSRVNDFTTDTYPGITRYVKDATGFNVLSVGYEPCGQPPLGQYSGPHYVLQWYYLTQDQRKQVTCSRAEHTLVPLCTENDDNDKFFKYPHEGSNLLDGFTNEGLPVGIRHTGMHWWRHPVESRTSPVALSMGTYDGEVSFWGMMFPSTSLLSGSGRDMRYISPTNDCLPYGFDLHKRHSRLTVSVYIPVCSK
mmetsp:Transcript_513/g.1126  ORF Transcript_513/g.1126 Transcript_513/m.1126 type:complete len:296 (+) Transcript_513:119-1006(+)